MELTFCWGNMKTGQCTNSVVADWKVQGCGEGAGREESEQLGKPLSGQEGEAVRGEDWVLSPEKRMQHLEDKGR